MRISRKKFRTFFAIFVSRPRLICRSVTSNGLLVCHWASIVFRGRFYSSELSCLGITTQHKE